MQQGFRELGIFTPKCKEDIYAKTFLKDKKFSLAVISSSIIAEVIM